MVVAHRFVRDFFSQADFYSRLFDGENHTMYEMVKSDDPEFGKVKIVCGMKGLYLQFKQFARDFYNGTRVRLNTFAEQ